MCALKNSAPPIYTVKLLVSNDDGEEEREQDVTVGANEHILNAANAQGIVLPAMCRQGRCVTCAGRIVGGGEVDNSDADLYFPQDRAAGFVLLCTAKPCSDLIIRTHQQDSMRAHRLALGLPAPYG
ncbi:MAG: ferredoxin [Candidatus Angelobacter sp.]|jgi:ferredoxin|nr:ferredoxin [Candidatus Angelobacter sp.]